MKHQNKRYGIESLLASHRWSILAGATFIACFVSMSTADAVISVAGQLIVDVWNKDLSADSPTWINHAAGTGAVGDFTTVGGENANVITGKADGTYSANALFIDNTAANSMISAMTTPDSVEGNNSRSVELWLWSDNADEGEEGTVGWGTTGNGQYSTFRYNNSTSNGKWSGWFIDSGWNELTTGQWVHVAYTYDGTEMKGYLNGALHDTDTLTGLNNHPLSTAETVISIGSGNGGTRDVFGGFIGAVRVHTDVLSDAQILNNFGEGIVPDTSVLACDFDGDNNCDSDDFGILRDNLFTDGGVAQGDYNRDAHIDLLDYRGFKDDANVMVGSIPLGGLGSGVQVPEPSSLGCSILGLAVFGAFVVSNQRCTGV